MPELNWQRRATAMRVLVLCSYILLLLVIAAGTLIWTGGRAPNPTIWALLTLPLLSVLPGLLRADVRAHAWLSFIAMLYFAMAVMGLADLQWRLLDILELILSVELFVGTMLFVRWRSRALREPNAAQES